MKKSVWTSVFAAAALACSLAPVHAASDVAEVRLVDNIDESRGYCLDIAGGRGENAPLDRGLQAHTCYDYSGELLVDQSFDVALLEQGTFKIPYFDVCMAATALDAGASIELAACDGSELQQFMLQDNGNLVATAVGDLCITTSATEKKEGRGATPVHVMRPLSLQPCSDENSAYQVWMLFTL